jgi:hypothetical protein
MPPKKASPAAATAAIPCGPLAATPSDIPITEVDTPEKIWSMVQVACDDNTGVFFFRDQRRIYLRYVETE